MAESLKSAAVSRVHTLLQIKILRGKPHPGLGARSSGAARSRKSMEFFYDSRRVAKKETGL